MILSIFARHNTRQPGVGRLPPLNPVPAPRVTTGVLDAFDILKTEDTSSVFRGKMTASGSCFRAAVPSKE
jgi:hypothetical protein